MAVIPDTFLAQMQEERRILADALISPLDAGWDMSRMYLRTNGLRENIRCKPPERMRDLARHMMPIGLLSI
jgi:hypothetical protein